MLTAAIALTAGVVLAGQFEIPWHTTDGGGGTSTGGPFALSGTIGQPDAGQMSGGSFAITGGFWAIPASGGGCTRDPVWQCDGDVDGDRQVNPVDSGLIQAAFGSTDQGDLCQYDVDCDGQINPVDSGIVQSLFGTCESPRGVCP
jgi:hypothetical protein